MSWKVTENRGSKLWAVFTFLYLQNTICLLWSQQEPPDTIFASKYIILVEHFVFNFVWAYAFINILKDYLFCDT